MAAFHIQFISEILEAFGQLPIILCGDFNSRHPLWFDSTTNKNGYILKSIIEEQNLFVHNLKIPTCRNASIIDLTISNKNSIGLIHNWRTSALSVTSDHLAILFDIFNMINLANNNRQTSTWKFREKSANWTKFAESISPSDLLDLNSASKHIVNCEDIDNVVNKLTNLVIEAAYSSLDVKHHTSINTTTSKNWWNKELQQLKEHLHYLRNLYYRGGNLNPSIYRAARNKYLRAINRAKKTSWKIFIEENESTNAFGNAYRIFKRLRSADIQVGIPLLNKTAECMREQKMKEMLTAFFPDDDVRLDNEEHTLIRNHIPSFTNREIIFITEKEIKDLCSNLNIRKAPGPDNVSNYMIKHSLLSILPSLVKLFNECLVLGYYPESWKHSVLKIITKPQKADYEAINSYRPISLTSNFSKIFETIIKNKILNYYNHNNLLSHRQHGFTKRKSTITALDKITETILKHKQNELVALIAIDISGAFDNAWWPALIKRMDEDHVPAVLIKIIQSFLNRRRKTSLTFSNTTISKYLSKGCPQGGPLSPLLWNIVLNDLLINFASSNSEIICYADDVSIVCWHKTIEGLKNETERTSNYVIQWCTRNKLKLSPEKTGLIHMHGKQNIPMGTPNFIIKPVEEQVVIPKSTAADLRKEGYQITIPQSRPLSPGEILGCTAPRLPGIDTIIYLGDGRFHLEAVMIANPDMEVFSSKAFSKKRARKSLSKQNSLVTPDMLNFYCKTQVLRSLKNNPIVDQFGMSMQGLAAEEGLRMSTPGDNGTIPAINFTTAEIVLQKATVLVLRQGRHCRLGY
ncbi:hypothetical protein LAZ67_8003077 [Cordylochernes scorpioides]|uniref:2-(3-amino-3-carboxypropyl)histidine synthase subunit 1 n=1 Tax=Cordylochernes scorpioides TaxID=51811 RepID=A0ABY6KTA5_9ARAC|nr:hypothetical protein LAZ67_8003077 [Cordylochernes scorpioides]